MLKMTLAALAATTVLCAQAQAVTYTYNPTSIGPTTPQNSFYTTSTPVFTLAITDAAVQSGSFAYSYGFGRAATGNVQGLQRFTANNGAISFAGGGGPAALLGDTFSVNLTFSPTGAVTAGSLTYSDDTFQLSLSGTSAAFNGDFAVGTQPRDTVVGTLVTTPTPVPEPATLGLLGLAVGAVACRRRRAPSPN